MSFDLTGFMKARYQPRTADVLLSGLKHWFGVDEQPVFTVRGLTSCEVAAAHSASSVSGKKSAAVDGMTDSERVRNEVKQLLGVLHNGDVHDDTKMRTVLLINGCIEPKLDEAAAIKLSQCHTGEFRILTNKIQELTALGADLEKPTPSGKAKK